MAAATWERKEQSLYATPVDACTKTVAAVLLSAALRRVQWAISTF